MLLEVKGRKQQDNRCGPNALAILLKAAGQEIPETEIAEAVQNPRTDATLSIDLVLYARKLGYPARFETGNTSKLQTALRDGFPTILLLDLSAEVPWPLSAKQLWHYVVAYGFSETAQRLYIHSGMGAKSMDYDKLDNMWRRGGYWMMHLGVPLPESRQ